MPDGDMFLFVLLSFFVAKPPYIGSFGTALLRYLIFFFFSLLCYCLFKSPLHSILFIAFYFTNQAVTQITA